ncbi:stathmin domain-containing protein 1, partial [Bombina bombina]|uniref:stathmin domain-containing protein 1 n=1 Tax=Bombina bombina TaxID=8345 RepID=UPI00235A7895
GTERSYTHCVVAMGCGHSRVLVVQPTDGRKSGWGAKGKAKEGTQKDDNKSPRNNDSSVRDGSAVSKGTVDSGLGAEDEAAGGVLPGAITEKLPSPRDSSSQLNKDPPLLSTRSGSIRERQKSSDILEELITQGIIQSQPKIVKNGEAYDVMVETEEKPLRRPPAKLEKLKTIRRKNVSLTIEEIESKMKAAEERRKTKEEELKERLRRDRPVTALQSTADHSREGSFTPDEGQEAATVLHETLEFGTTENLMTKPAQWEDEEADEINAVESDITYNDPGHGEKESANYIF